LIDQLYPPYTHLTAIILLRKVRTMTLIKVITVGDEHTPREELQTDLEEACRDMYDKGWFLASTSSRGGTIYCIFTKNFH